MCACIATVIVSHCVLLDKNDDKYYFSTTQGDWWVYTYTDKENKKSEEVDSTEVVLEVEDKMGEKDTKIVTVGTWRYVYPGSKPVPSTKYEVSKDRLAWTENLLGRKLESPAHEIRVSEKVDYTWNVHDRDTQGLISKRTAKRIERIKVPAGEFDAIRIEERDQRSANPRTICWYTKSLGMVKRVDYAGDTELGRIVMKEFHHASK